MKRVQTWGLALLLLAACGPQGPKKPRLCLFVGLDVSGSFLKGPHYEDGLEFLGRYLHAHMNGLGGLDVPDQVFVGAIGGRKKDESKTFFPKQTFAGKAPEEITATLRELFPNPKKPKDDRTDYNAFFEQVAETVRAKNLVLRPISIVMIADGVPAFRANTPANYRSIRLDPLENLSRNVAVRLLYASPTAGKNWRTQVPRRRIKLWTQDAAVMAYWKDPQVLQPGVGLREQDKFFAWVKDNVNFPVRAMRVD